MRTGLQLICAASLLVVSPMATALAQQVKVETSQQYLMLEVVKLDTFEKEIGSAADQGFRLMMSTTNDNGSRIQALMERAATPPDVFRYRMVATFSDKTGDNEMNAAGAEGFRLVPNTAMVKKGLTVFNVNSVVIMERIPKSSETFEYRTITAVRTSTFHAELRAAVDEGWKVVDTTYGRVLLERRKGAT